MTKNELEIGRKRAREIANQLWGWKANLVTDDDVEHLVQGVVEAIDDYRKAKKD